MNERIKLIREKLGLSQETLGKALGIGRSAVSRIESGTNALTEANIRLLCQQYGVNRKWLESGEGEMFLQGDDAVIADVAEKYHLSELDKEAFKLYLKLDERERQGLMSFSFSLAGKILENPALYREYKRARGELPKLSQADIEVEVAAYRAELELLADVERDTDTEAQRAGVADAEAAYEKSLGFVPNTGLSASNTTGGTASRSGKSKEKSTTESGGGESGDNVG